MGQELLITAVVLGAAFMHATWNALVKTGADRVATLALISTVWLVAGGAAAAVLPLPAAASWPNILLSTALHYGYVLGLLWMYREGDLSHVYPIARGSAPLALALLSPLVAGEALSGAEWLGVGVVSLGIVSLAFERGPPWAQGAGPVAGALFTAATITAYTLTDGLGVRISGTAPGYAAWLFCLQGVPWLFVLARLRLRAPERVPLRALGPGLLAGVLSMAAYTLVLWALSLAPVAPIAALRETGVIFAALIGALRLGEPFGRRRIAAAVLVAAGVALLNVPG